MDPEIRGSYQEQAAQAASHYDVGFCCGGHHRRNARWLDQWLSEHLRHQSWQDFRQGLQELLWGIHEHALFEPQLSAPMGLQEKEQTVMECHACLRFEFVPDVHIAFQQQRYACAYATCLLQSLRRKESNGHAALQDMSIAS